MNTRDPVLSRRGLLLAAGALGLTACDGGAAPAPQARAPARTPPGMPPAVREPAPEAAARAPAENAARTPEGAPVVTMLGDSITAGYGLSAAQALPVQLEAALRDLGVPANVRGAGVSGDTTAGALARVDFSVRDDSDVVVVALGGNDLLQGVAPAQVKRNLDAIVRKLKARRMTVVLAGMRGPPQFGSYTREFDAVFADLAREQAVAFYPFLLNGVALVERYNQSDGIHPNAEGARLIAAGLAPVVAQALQRAAPRP